MEKSLEDILKNNERDGANILSILQKVEETFGYIPEESVNWLSKRIDIPASRIFGIITFYSQFHLKPRGENILTVCRGTACHVKGSEKLINRLFMELGIPPHEDTSDDLKFTVQKVNCLGACGIAPVIVCNKDVHAKMSLNKLTKLIRKMRSDE